MNHHHERIAMSHTPQIRTRAAAIADDADRFAGYAEAAECESSRTIALAAALVLRRHATVILGDIGEDQEEWELEPLTVPVEVPAEPVPVP